jgi:hypothetical protein
MKSSTDSTTDRTEEGHKGMAPTEEQLAELYDKQFLHDNLPGISARSDGIWKIRHRTCVWDCCEVRPMKPGWNVVNVPRTSNRGNLYPEDPIYKDWQQTEPTPYQRESTTTRIYQWPRAISRSSSTSVPGRRYCEI